MEEMMKTTKAEEDLVQAKELVQAKMRREITKLDDEEVRLNAFMNDFIYLFICLELIS